jgi:hypothetical protein
VGCKFQEFFGSPLESAINVGFSVTVGDAFILLYFTRRNMDLHYFTFACALLYTYKFVIGPYTFNLSVNNFSKTFKPTLNGVQGPNS